MAVNLADPRLQTALNRINDYRQRAGVAPCTLNANLVQAAQAHADYFKQNAPLSDPHGETAGKPGFTGVSMSDRTKAAGYANSASTNENVSYLADPAASIDGFMATVNHRAPILDPGYGEIGFGFATTADGKSSITVVDFGTAVFKDTYDPNWIIYPPDSTTNFPLSYGGESPNPFAASSPHFPIGNPITIQYRGAGNVAYDGTKFSLTDQNGLNVPIYPAPTLTMYATRKSAALASQTPLQPNTTYTVVVAYTVGSGTPQTRSWKFSTGSTITTGSNLFDSAGLGNADANVKNLWQSADAAVASGAASRTWIYGPKAFDRRQEPYVESPGGQRTVYYFDKARMEISNPTGDRNSQWFITTGRLVYELISGQMQLGDNKFESHAAAEVAVAGDPTASNPDAPTYASFRFVASLNNDKRAANRAGQPVLETLSKAGNVTKLSAAPAAAKYSYYDDTLGHNIPDVLINWMNTLPNSWIFVLGLPLSEPYWARVKVGGQVKDVLMQVFERRALTYTPSNSAAWQVEMGNVGQHYHFWRYGN